MIACLRPSTMLVVVTVALLGTLDSTGRLDAVQYVDPTFLRGDVNDDGVVDLADAWYLLSWLVEGGEAPHCLKAADVNDDGVINLEDYVFMEDCLLFADVMPPPPFPENGSDPTADDLPCGAPVPPVELPILRLAPNTAAPGSFVLVRLPGEPDEEQEGPLAIYFGELRALITRVVDPTTVEVMVPNIDADEVTLTAARGGETIATRPFQVLPAAALRLLIAMNSDGEMELLSVKPCCGGYTGGTGEGGPRLLFDVYSGDSFVFTAVVNHPFLGRGEVYGPEEGDIERLPASTGTAVFSIKIPNVPGPWLRFSEVGYGIDVSTAEGRQMSVLINEMEIQ